MITDEVENENPLDDPLNDLGEDGESVGEENDIITQLEAQVDKEAAIEAKKKRPRQQSTREEEWIARLVEAYGDDTSAMFKDRKLNPMQQSQGDIARRLKKWKAKHG